MLFAIQFIWQFPHFWAIAWILHDDYSKAGFRMLPSLGGRDKSSAFQILVYSLFLTPISLTLWMFNLAGWAYFGIVMAVGIIFFLQALKFYRTMEMADAKRLMFYSFFWLPIVQFAYVFNSI